jgi:hypothetical protein
MRLLVPKPAKQPAAGKAILPPLDHTAKATC